MNNGVRTAITCPCCQRLFIENCCNTRQWDVHKQRIGLRQFRKYLNLVLSRSNEGIVAKGSCVKLDKKKPPDFAPTREERKSLLYQTEFIAMKKREAEGNGACISELHGDLTVTKCCNDLKTYNEKDIKDETDQPEQQARKMNERRVHLVERRASAQRRRSPKDLVIKKCDGNDFEKFNVVNLKNKKDIFEKREKVESQELMFPIIAPESQSKNDGKTGSTVIQFTDENVKLDIFLPTLM